jgi:hypothetical protein
MKARSLSLLIIIVGVLQANSFAQGFATGKLNTLHNYGILSEKFDRSYLGLSSEIGYETETVTYQLEAGFYFPRQIDSVMYRESPSGLYLPALVDESSTVFSLAIMGRYYLFSSYTDAFRPYTNSGVVMVFEHVNQDMDSGFETWNETFTNKNLTVSAGLGFELALDNDLSPFLEILGYFPLADFDTEGDTIFEIPFGVGLKVSGGMKFYLGGY